MESIECKCPKCGSKKVRSYDNESLYHPAPEDIAKCPNGGHIDGTASGISHLYGIDDYITYMMVCDEPLCLHKFRVLGKVTITEIK